MNKKTPVFDRTKPFGDIYGAEGAGDAVAPRFAQGGHYFSGDGTYLSSDKSAPLVEEVAKVEVNRDTTGIVSDDAEIELLLTDPRAETLLSMDREHITAMVTAAGGAVVSGEGSQRLMAAWLLKNTV